VLFVGTVNGSNTALITGSTHTVIFEGLQVEATLGTSTSAAILPFASGTGTVRRNLVRALLASQSQTGGRGIWISGTGTSIIANNVVFDLFSSSFPASAIYRAFYHSAGNAVVYNNTAVRCAVGFESANPGGVTISLKNNLSDCASFNASRVDYSVGAGLDANSTNNASSDTTAPGAEPQTSKTFTYQNAAGNDFRLASGDVGAKDLGADLSADPAYAFSVDAGGQTRTGTWDIGADEYGVGTSIAITSPASGRIYQRIAGAADISVAGTYSGSPAGIRARLVLNGTSTPVSGFDWATVVASPTGGNYAFTLVGVPSAASMYQIEVSFTDLPAVASISGPVGVGELIAVVGQSNADALFGGAGQSGNASALLRQTLLAGSSWTSPVAAGAVGLGNDIVASLNVPVGLVNTSVSGTSINSWIPGGTQYINAMAKINAVGGKVGAFVWVQGEYEAQTAGVYADYLSKLGQVFDTGFRVDLSQPAVPVIIVPLGSYNDGGASLTAGFADVRRAQHEWGANANNYTVERIDCEVPNGSIHLSNTANGGAWVLGRRCALAIAVSKGVGTEWRGPAISKVAVVSPTVYDVTITHRAGTDFTPASGITGLEVRDPGNGNAVVAVSTAVRQSATVFRVTLATAPVSPAPLFSYLPGASPDVSGVLVDNSLLALPLGWAPDIPASSATILKYWDGSVWLIGSLKSWDGADWVAAPLKRWDGAAWLSV